MPFQVGNGCFPAAVSDSRIARIARSDTPPEMSTWEKVKEFFCSTNKPEALELIWQICHPPAGTTREEVAGRFERLRTLAYGGFEENVQSGRHGENHFCILDENSREMLSVTLDDAGKYTVKCQGHRETHHLIPDTEPGEERAEQAEGASGTLRAEHAATTVPKTAEEYEAVWSAWERAAPAGESPHRAEAVRKMLDCLHNGNPELNLDNLDITSLPDLLPPDITGLYVNRVPLNHLPPLPSGLQKLYVGNNQLDSLPALPHTLKTLFAVNARLRSLPPLPAGLINMEVAGNQLRSLPPLPHTLRTLYVNDNQLRSLPPLPHTLRTLYVNYNQLRSLPASITGLPPDVRVSLYNNPLSERTLQDLETVTGAPDYSGPVILFSMGGPAAPRETRPLHLAVADWLTPAKEGEPSPADRWQSFGQEHDAASFSAFLDRLSETENCKKDSGFKAQISSWLTQLAEDNELRAKTFAMATEATSSCEDRVTLALNQMKNVQLVHDAEKGKYDNNLPGLVSAGREMFRVDKLVQIARDKVKTLKFVDEIEVYLGYLNKLKEALELSSVTKFMRFFGVAHITESDLQAAELQVKTAENSQFSEWILQWAPLRSVLERAYPEDWKTLNKKKISDYYNAYRTLSDTELKPAGLTGNADAEREIGARALESAEKAFLDGLRPLANKMLDGHLKARWS